MNMKESLFKSLRCCTGFFDRNGKKIFKGEILKWIDTQDNHNKKECLGAVEWNSVIGLWEVKNDEKHIYDFLCHIHNHSIVIGNIFDNLELLEEEIKEK